MNKLLVVVLAATLVSCGEDFELNKQEPSIATRGNSVAVTTEGGEYQEINLDSVRVYGNEYFSSNDSLPKHFKQVDLKKCRFFNLEKLSSQTVQSGNGFFVTKDLYKVNLIYQNQVIIDIMFTKGEFHSSFVTPALPQFEVIENKFISIDSLITDEEEYSRSYFNLKIAVSERGEHIGTIDCVVSFYTRNIPITFAAEIVEEE